MRQHIIHIISVSIIGACILLSNLGFVYIGYLIMLHHQPDDVCLPTSANCDLNYFSCFLQNLHSMSQRVAVGREIMETGAVCYHYKNGRPSPRWEVIDACDGNETCNNSWYQWRTLEYDHCMNKICHEDRAPIDTFQRLLFGREEAVTQLCNAWTETSS